MKKYFTKLFYKNVSRGTRIKSKIVPSVKSKIVPTKKCDTCNKSKIKNRANYFL